MKTSQRIIRTIAAGIVALTGACSGAGLTDPADSADVGSVSVSLATIPYALNGFEGPADSVALVAYIRDTRNNAINNRPVTWELLLTNGTQAGDTIASIVSTGPRTATMVFHRDVVVGVVASVRRTDGTSRSDTLYMVPDAR